MPRETINESVGKRAESRRGYGEDSVGTYLRQIGKVALLDAADEVELAKDIEAGLYAGHLLEETAENGEELPIARRRELALMERVGKRANDHMIEANLRLAVSLAKRYTGRGMAFQDLIQEGNLGLMHAVEKFDYTKGYKFSTYATWWVRQAITRAMADQARTIRIPVHTVEQINKMERIKREMFQDLGREASREEITEEMGVDLETVVELEEYGKSVASLDMPVGENEGDTLINFLEVEDSGVDGEVEFMAMQDELDKFLEESLTPRELDVIKRRKGLYDGKSWILEEVAPHVVRADGTKGVTRERVRQIETKAMEKLYARSIHNTALSDFLQE